MAYTANEEHNPKANVLRCIPSPVRHVRRTNTRLSRTCTNQFLLFHGHTLRTNTKVTNNGSITTKTQLLQPQGHNSSMHEKTGSDAVFCKGSSLTAVAFHDAAGHSFHHLMLVTPPFNHSPKTWAALAVVVCTDRARQPSMEEAMTMPGVAVFPFMAAGLSACSFSITAAPRMTEPGSRTKTATVGRDVAHVDRCGKMNGGSIQGSAMMSPNRRPVIVIHTLWFVSRGQ